MNDSSSSGGGVDRLAAEVAHLLDRRAFIRKAAATTFKAAAVVFAGGTISQMLSTPAWANCGGAAGSGCPTAKNSSGGTISLGCGPSRCCNFIRSGRSGNCNCASGTSCVTRANYCFGRDTRDWSTGCWSCTTSSWIGTCQYRNATTCCDCRTSTANCGDPNHGSGQGTCIGWSNSRTLVGCL